MIRRQPQSTLVPYTTLFRSLSKHIKYAQLESNEWVKWRLKQGGGGAPAQHLFRSVLLYRQWLRRQVWPRLPGRPFLDRKSTRLNSSHANISYAVFCLKQKRT